GSGENATFRHRQTGRKIRRIGGRARGVLMPETLRITVLGSATSSGVPTIGCPCATSASTDPRDNRLRPSVLMQYGGKNVLIDTTPDFRAQALRRVLTLVDGI